jgi:MoaA/NifB/PqqE/SkfB family radical SAM enzyme
MQRVTMAPQQRQLVWTLVNTRRRLGWFLDNLSPARAANLALAGAEFLARREVMRAWPVVLKVDISPLCNLACTICVHARPSESSHGPLKQQQFRAAQKMPLSAFEQLVDEVHGRTSALSLYYLGDPLMHPDLAAMCRYAARYRLNTHVSTNLSFDLDDAAVEKLVESGLTHLTVCVDGLTQELYQRTRVGGNIERVIDNLSRIVRHRNALGRTFPKVEVQFIKYQHNEHERDEAAARFAALGIDQFTDYWGALYNYTDLVAGSYYDVHGPRAAGAIPRCLWPHFAMVVKFDGDVIPCCNYRHGEQYVAGGKGDARVVGNALRDGVRAVWNSEPYRAMRRLVSNPARAAAEPESERSFCSGCPSVYETSIDDVRLRGQAHAWDEVYERDARGHVRRRAQAEPKLIPLGRRSDR